MYTYDPLNTADTERTEAKTKAKRELDIKREEDDYRWLMKGPRGRAIVWRLLTNAGVFQGSWDTVAMKMAFNEGRRWYGTMLWALVNRLCPEDVVKMQQEASNGSDDDGNAPNSN